MSLTFAIAVYFIIWWLVLFTVLPFGVRTQEEAGSVVPGTPESAPSAPRLARVFALTTAIACVMFALVYWMIVSPDTRGIIDRLFTALVGFPIFAE